MGAPVVVGISVVGRSVHIGTAKVKPAVVQESSCNNKL